MLAMIWAAPGLAQVGAVGQPGLNAALLKLFGDTTGFSAQAHVRVLDKAQDEIMALPMTFAMLDGKVRAEIDLGQAKAKELSKEDLAALKQLRMERVTSIVRPDKGTTIAIYPEHRAYAEMPMTPEDVADLKRDYKVAKQPVGKETIDGHPVEKHKIVVTGENNQRHEAFVWNATDLKDFPIRIQLNQGENTLVMQFKDVKLARPDARQFDPPNRFTKYESVEKLMQEAMMKSLGTVK